MPEDFHSVPASSVSDEDKAAFVLSFTDASDKHRKELVDIWEESLANYFVRPPGEINWRGRTDKPISLRSSSDRGRLGFAVLKDPESHQIVETLLSKLWNALFSEAGYVKAKARGTEDAFKADTASRLIEYDLNLEGHARTMYQWLKDMLIYGTGIIEVFWHFKESARTFRRAEENEFGQIESVFETLIAPEHDDPRIKNLNIMDYYPDPGEQRLSWMRRSAKRFQITAKEALLNVKTKGWDAAAVNRAIHSKMSESSAESEDYAWQEEIKLVSEADIPADFSPMVGFEYWGEVPWKTEDGFDLQVLTTLSTELVHEKDWPLPTARLPFFDATINPVEGRFYGVGPLETGRYDQDFMDTLKRMIANAVVRGTMSQPIVNENAALNQQQFRNFNPDVPIVVQTQPQSAVSYLDYRPPIEGAINQYGNTKQQMREGSGALGAIQGLGLGTKRFSATEAAESFQQAFDRPEMIGRLIEMDSLPPLGKFLLHLNQRFLLDDDEGFALRVGERPPTVVLADIMADFDVTFVGSRQVSNKQTMAQSIERFIAVVGNIPPIAVKVPWDPVIAKYTTAIGLDEIAALMPDGDAMVKNILLQQLLGANAQNNNGETQDATPQGLNPAQTGGRTLGV